jgi:hypothetical protein
VIVNAVLAILTRSESTLPQTHSVLIPDAVVGVVKQSATALPVYAAQAMQRAAKVDN